MKKEYSQWKAITSLVIRCVCVCVCVCQHVFNSEIQTGGGVNEKCETLINLFNFAGGGLTTLSVQTAACGINGRVNSKY